MTIQQAPLWLAVVSLLGTGGGLMVLYRLIAHWLDHLRLKRQQSDNVAMGMVAELRDRVTVLEAKNAQLEAEVRIVEGWEADWLLLLFRHVPHDRQDTMIDEVATMRERRRGERRQGEQIGLSMLHVLNREVEAAKAA